MEPTTNNQDPPPLNESEIDDAFASIAQDLKVPPLALTAQESEILDLYDQIQELRLENALMDAQISQAKASTPNPSAEAAPSLLQAAGDDNLDARAAYLLKESIVKNVVQADPLLKAIHSGANGSPLERYPPLTSSSLPFHCPKPPPPPLSLQTPKPLTPLPRRLHPLIDARDTLSLSLTPLSTRHQSLSNTLSSVRTSNIRLLHHNQSLTSTLLSLAAETKEPQAEDIPDETFQREMGEAKQKTGVEKRQWRIVKGLVSALVAGSGVDWAADEKLRGLVEDGEE
ncbi:hypothetical protein MMC10_002081 [Thelotrema lepadinum]|nr:hypothetical protein [Thelotrema lepadinum]